MGIFDRFPYSSTHEMNLDFMLGKATEIAEDMQRVTAGMEQVQAGLSAISEKTEQATQAAAQAATSASSIEGSVTAAEEAAEEAQMHNESAQTWANNAMTYKADCQRSATEAAASSSSAAQAATAAAASEDTVAQYAQAANASAQSAANNNDSAHQYANQASASASNATFHSSNAQTAATNAQTAATNANTSATNASASADRAASLKSDVETLHRMCTAAVDQAANSAAQAAAAKTDVENLVESLPEDFTDLNNTVNQLSDEIETADFMTIVNADTDMNKPYNLIPPDCTFEPNKYVRGTDGEIVDSSSGTVATGYIEINPSQEYLCHVLKVRIIGVAGITSGYVPIDDDVKSSFAFYDQNKNYIPYTGPDSSSVSKIIPANARYFRFTLNAVNVVPYAMLVYGNYDVAPLFAYTHYRHDIKQKQTYAATGLENLKMVMFGDSITHGDLGVGDDGLSYIDYANNYLRSNIINCGLGASRMSQGVPTGVGLGSFASLCENIVSDDADAWDALEAYITPSGSANHDWLVHVEKLKAMDWNKVQAIGLLYGANDWANNVALGTEYNEDPLKYDGACAYGLKKLLTKYPHLQVILFTPFYRKISNSYDSDMQNNANHTINDYGRSLFDNVQPKFHCPVIDSGNEVGMNRYNISLYAPDGTHPRANLGQYRLGRYFAEAIKRYVQPF